MDPLLGVPRRGDPKPSKWYQLSLLGWIAIFLVAILTASTAYLAFRIFTTASSTTPVPPPSAPPDYSYDFPLYPFDPWNIDEDGQHTRAISLPGQDEVTWSNLDVSPDGQRLVFDMLGDLYTLPIGGGEATILRGGVAWDTQPRFSPDGLQILFTSDQSGCQNIWILTLADNFLQQVTFSNYTSASAGNWRQLGGDLPTIVAMVGLYSTRSLQAGEIWEYDIPEAGAISNPGRQLIGRSTPSSQVGPEEPFVAPDGNTLFYSINTADGTTWTYNKNPHPGIYVVRSLHIPTGQTATLASGPGGASKPIVSPDGKSLVFVRRLQFQSVLIRQSLSSGNEQVLWTDLSFDQQACYAPTGTYPNYAFLPSGDALVVWAHGHFWRVPFSGITGKRVAEQISFSVNVHLQIAPTVRGTAQVVSPNGRFRVRVVQWPTFATTADGAVVVAYTAVGDIYTRQLQGPPGSAREEGEPRLLMRASSDGEFRNYPSYVPGTAGQRMAVVAWSDSRLSQLRIIDMPLSSSAPLLVNMNVTDKPSRLAQVSFSPLDPSLLLYRVLGSDSISGPSYPRGTGIYVATVPALATQVEGATERKEEVIHTLLRGSGDRPRWAAHGLSVWVQTGSSPNRQLVEVKLTRGGMTTIQPDFKVSSEVTSGHTNQSWTRHSKSRVQVEGETVVCSARYATDVAMSPSRDWIAFIEFGQVYVASVGHASFQDRIGSNSPPMVSAHSRFDTADLESIRLSTLGAHWMDWELLDSSSPTSASSRLRWVHAAALYEVDVVEVIARCSSGSVPSSASSLAAPSCVQSLVSFRAFDLGFQAEQDSAADPFNVYCLNNATVAAVRAADPFRVDTNQRIVVRGDQIAAMGDSATVACPAEARGFVDVQGGLVTPGFIDTHAHWSGGGALTVHSHWEFMATLAFGVTTMHNPSKDTVAHFSESELEKAGKKAAPRLLSTGTIVYGAGGPGHCDVPSVNEARILLQRLKAYGAVSVKSYNQPCRAARMQILSAARELNLNVVPEGGMNVWNNLNQIIDGHTTIEHNLPIAPLFSDVLQLFSLSGTTYTPTLGVSFGGIQGENYFYDVDNVWENQRLMTYAPHNTVRARSLRRPKAEHDDYYHIKVAEAAAALLQHGTRITPGAHGQLPGLAYSWELRMLAQGGMSAMEVLRAATLHAAQGYGLDTQLGSLEVGKLADLVVFPAGVSPLTSGDWSLLDRVRYVMKGGRMWEAATMNQILPEFQLKPGGPLLDFDLTSKRNVS